MGRKARLDDERFQQIFLQTLRDTGIIGDACNAIGLSDEAVLNYRRKHPGFDNAVKLAKALADIRERIEYDILVRNDAWKELHQRIKDGTAKDETLMRVIEGIKVR